MSKKSTAKTKDEVVYEIGDIVLGKIKGFPAWPAKVIDPNSVSEEVARERPAGKKTTFYCARFFPKGDYAWLTSKELSKLKTHEIEAYINEPHKKNGELLAGYRVALNPEEWEREMQNKREAAEEAKADEEVDELEGEEEADDDDQPAKPKKRKRDSESAPKTKTKAKKDKDTGDAPPKKKKTAEKGDKPTKSKKNGSKSKEMVESEDDGENVENGGPSKKASPPPAKKSKRGKEEDGDVELDNNPEASKVKEMRHKIQRGFLGKALPKLEDMPNFDSLFTQVEEFEMSIDILQYSKIGKVMRHIAALEVEKVPRDDEFKFKDRAQALVNKWHTTINIKPNGTSESAKVMDIEPPPSTANGNVAPSAASEAKTVLADVVMEDKKADEKVDEPQPGDTTIAQSALGDVTMSEIAA